MKTTIKTWLIIILLVTNLTTIISFSYQRNKINRQLDTNYPMRPQMPRQMGGRFIMNEMNLNNEQREAFINHHKTFQYKARNISNELDVKREEFMKELAQDHPSQQKLDQIADEIGNYHKKLKMETVHFYQNLKQECSPDQMDELQGLFIKMANPERRMMRNNRNRKGQGYQKRINRNKNRQFRNQY